MYSLLIMGNNIVYYKSDDGKFIQCNSGRLCCPCILFHISIL